MKLILPQLFLTEFVRALAEVAGELFDGIQISSDRCGRVITTLEFLQHPLSQCGHVSLLEAHKSTGRRDPSWLSPRAASAASAASFKSPRIYPSCHMHGLDFEF